MQSVVSLDIAAKALIKVYGNVLHVKSEGLCKIADSKGAYILSIHLEGLTSIAIPKMKTAKLQPGTYLYAGSAYGSGGIAARLKRHFKKHKKVHWHVDRLTSVAVTVEALAVLGGNECVLTEALISSGQFKTAIHGFGNSDCRTCDSHLLKLSM